MHKIKQTQFHSALHNSQLQYLTCNTNNAIYTIQITIAPYTITRTKCLWGRLTTEDL